MAPAIEILMGERSATAGTLAIFGHVIPDMDQ